MEKILYDQMDWAGIEEIVYSESSDPGRLLGAHVVKEASDPGVSSGGKDRGCEAWKREISYGDG